MLIQLVVFNVMKRAVIANLGFSSVHGVWAVPEIGRVYASTTGEHTVTCDRYGNVEDNRQSRHDQIFGWHRLAIAAAVIALRRIIRSGAPQPPSG